MWKKELSLKNPARKGEQIGHLWKEANFHEVSFLFNLTQDWIKAWTKAWLYFFMCRSWESLYMLLEDLQINH